MPGSGSATTAGRSGGRTKKNQDAVFVVQGLEGLDIDLYCVLDGHGPYGDTVAKWLSANIPFAMQV